MASRREFLQKSLLAGIGVTVLGKSALDAKTFFAADAKITDVLFLFSLPKLPYAYDALEPWIDKRTMEIHYSKHHQAYVDNLNKARAKAQAASQESGSIPANPVIGEISSIDTPTDSLAGRTELEDILRSAFKAEPAIRNNAGGHWNHTFFWDIMRAPAQSPNPNGPSGKLADDINQTFGDFEKFKLQFSQAAKDRFGSGWAWLIKQDGQLKITSTPNQDNPLMDVAEMQGTPLLGLDVWEHAYYLKYQNVRADYIAGWWNLVNWDKVNEHYMK